MTWDSRSGSKIEFRNETMELVFDSFPGWFTRAEAEALYFAVLRTEGPILEIGHFLGRSTSCICEALSRSPQQRVFQSYDLGHTTDAEFRAFFERVLGRTDFEIPNLYRVWVSEPARSCTDVARELLDQFDLGQHVELIEGDFRESDPDVRFGLIFSDVCHESSEISANLPAIAERSAPNCLWAFHDTSNENVALINKLVPRARFLYRAGSLGFFCFADPPVDQCDTREQQHH